MIGHPRHGRDCLAALVAVAAARTANFDRSHAGSAGSRPHALTAGYDLAFIIGGVLFLLIALIAVTVLPQRAKTAEPPESIEEEVVDQAIATEAP